MELVNHGENDFNLNNNRHRHDCAESSDEEIPLRPPRKTKQGSENEFAKQAKGQKCLNDLRTSFDDANQIQKDTSESRSGISCNYRQSKSEVFELNCETISSNEAHISSSDIKSVECPNTSTLVECNSVAENDTVENRYNLGGDACSKEDCELTISATGTITLPVRNTSYTELHSVSKYNHEKMSDSLSNRSRLKDDCPLIKASESDEDSFCSVESEEEIVGVDKSDKTDKTPVANGLESSVCKPVATSFSLSQKKEPQDLKKEGQSMSIGEERTHETNERENGESHLHELTHTYPNGFSTRHVAAGENQLQNCPTEKRNIPEEKSAKTVDQVSQSSTREFSTLKTDVENNNNENCIVESTSVSHQEISREENLDQAITTSNAIAHVTCKSGDEQLQTFKNSSTEPENTSQGGSDSSTSDSESSDTCSEGEYVVNHDEVFFGIDEGQQFKNGRNTVLEDDNSTSRKLDTVAVILSAFKHTEYLSTDESSNELTGFFSSTSSTDNVRDETKTNTNEPAGERNFDKDKGIENPESVLSTQNNSLHTTETREDFKSRNDNKTVEHKKFTLNDEAFEQHEGVCHWRFKDGALKSPVETIPEEAEDVDSRNPSRVGSQYFNINQFNLAQTVTRTKASVNNDKPELQTLLKTREKLLTDSSLRDFVSSSAEPPTSESSRTPLTSLSGYSSQNDEVFDTYFGAEEKTVSFPVDKSKFSELEFYETHFGREIQTARSEPSLFSQCQEKADQTALRRTESLSPAFRRRTAGFSQKRKGNCIKDKLRVSESPSSKTGDLCNDSKECESEISKMQTSNNLSKNEEMNASRSIFYRSLSFSGESAANGNNDEKQTDCSSSETSCGFTSYINGDSSSESSAAQKNTMVVGKTEQETNSAVSDTNKNGLLTPKSSKKDLGGTDKNSNSNIANRRKTLQKMRTKYVTSYDIEVAKQRRLSSELGDVDIKRITNLEDAETRKMEDEVKRNTEIETATPTRPPRHKKALKYSQSFATSRTTERRGGRRNKSERRSSRWLTMSSGVDVLTTTDKWRRSILSFGTTTFKPIPLEAANHGALTLVTDHIPAISASFPTDKRAQVVQELYETEITYVRILETVIEIFKKPLEENPYYMHAKDIETIFINISEIFKLNKDLLFLLCERVTHWTSHQLVGDIFVNMNPRFKIYAKFCSHYDAAESLIKVRAEKRKDFEAFLNACYNDPICQPDQNLQAHLIAVVQRIPRYIMLLGRLLERTPKSHPDYPQLELATSKMTATAEYINNQLQEFQGHKAMVELRSRLIGIKAFLTPDRWRIKEGEVSLMSPKKCYKLLLFNDLLVFVAKGATKQCEVELTMDLKTVWFADLGDKDPQTTKRDAFELYNPERSYTVYCETRNEKKNWLQKLRNAITMRLHGPEATEEQDIICRKKSGFTYKDERIYCGEFVDGKREGQGLLAWPNRNRYQGNWEDDERNGLGEMTYNTGDKYHGEWRDDKQHGIGTMKYSNGDFYTGEWYEGQMHGKGIIEFNNKDHFKGQFVRGEIKGVGTLKCVSGLRYDGHWQNSKKHGKGKLHYPNGDDYNGDFENDEKHGRGEMIYADQSTYLGEWVNDRRHSSGVYSCPDGTVYDGEWSKDLITGKGKMVYPNGDVYSGTWFMNQRFCKGVLKFHHGDVYDGEFEYNFMCGKGRMQYRNGGEYEGDWKAGQRSGNGKMLFADGGVYEGEWSHDLRHGKGKMAFPNGSTYEGSWEKDKQHGSGTFSHLESNYFYEGSWRYGKKDGKGVETTLKSTYDGTWKENMRHGSGKETLDSGTVLSGHWKENRKHGKVSVELRTGDVNHGVWEQMWQDGHLVDKSETVPVELPLLQHGN